MLRERQTDGWELPGELQQEGQHLGTGTLGKNSFVPQGSEGQGSKWAAAGGTHLGGLPTTVPSSPDSSSSSSDG